MTTDNKIVIAACVLIIIAYLYIKHKRIKSYKIELTDPVQLRFIKRDDYWDSYDVQFLNPVYNSWWTLPEQSSGVHELWGFKSKGSYGAYDLGTLKTCSSQVEWFRNKFKTLKDINDWFEKCNERYYSFQKMENRDRKLPHVL